MEPRPTYDIPVIHNLDADKPAKGRHCRFAGWVILVLLVLLAAAVTYIVAGEQIRTCLHEATSPQPRSVLATEPDPEGTAVTYTLVPLQPGEDVTFTQADYERTIDILVERMNRHNLAGVALTQNGESITVTLPRGMDPSEAQPLMRPEGVAYPPTSLRENPRPREIVESLGGMRMWIEADRDAFEDLDPFKLPAEHPEFYMWVPAHPEAPAANNPWFADDDGVDWYLVDWSPAWDTGYPVVDRARNEIFTGEDLDELYTTTNVEGELAIGFVFKDEDRLRARFRTFTDYYRSDGPHGRRLDPRLLVIVDGYVYWAGVIRSVLDGQGIMAPFNSEDERERLLDVMRSGMLPGRLVPIPREE